MTDDRPAIEAWCKYDGRPLCPLGTPECDCPRTTPPEPHGGTQ